MNFYQDILFRSADALRGRKTISRLKFLRKSQYWPRERLVEWQLGLLNEVLVQARDNSPLYAERLGGVRLPLTDLAEIEEIPSLSKADIRERLEDIKCRNISESRFIPSRTGGSTGEPLALFWDKLGRDWNRASVYRSAEWAGVALGEKAIQMGGVHFDYTSWQRFMVHRIVHPLQRYRELPMAAVSDELLRTYWDEIVAYNPTSIWGYSSALDLLAKYVERRQRDTDHDVVRALLPSSETLRPEQRDRITRAFGPDKVFDQYGSTEFYLGAECSAHNGYHLHSEVLLVEIVDHQNRAVPPGETGRVLVTDLSNHAFPYIRYEIGDLGVMADDADCSCGVRLPRLQSVEGRISDVVVLPDRVLTAPSLTGYFDPHRGIKAFQVRQESIDKLKIMVVPDEGYSESLIEFIMGGLRELAGEGVRLELIEVDEIEVPVSGKRRFIISDVSADYF